MKHDAEVLAMVPEGTKAHEALVKLVARDAERLLDPSRAARDGSGVALGVGGAGVFGWLAIWSLQRDGLGWILLGMASGFLWLVFFFGIFEAAQVKDRVAEKEEKARKKAEKERAKAEKERAKAEKERAKAEREAQEQGAAPGGS